MRVLATFDKFKDAISAEDACEIFASVIQNDSDGTDVIQCPLTDGGEGFVSILSSSVPARLVDVSARNSFGDEIQAQVAIVSFQDLSKDTLFQLELSGEGNLAILEMASVCGLASIESSARNPWLTSSHGVGDLLLAASHLKVDAILLGVGGTSTNDGGIGALVALGLQCLDSSGDEMNRVIPAKWGELKNFFSKDLAKLPPIRIACDVDNPLLGENGATYQFAPQKGLKDQEIERFEESMQSMVNLLGKFFEDASEKATEKGSGAAGGIGFGLSLFYDLKLVAGFELVSKWMGLHEKIRQADLIVTGEGKFDKTSFFGKGPFSIIETASQLKKPITLICGTIEKECEDYLTNRSSNISLYSLAEDNFSLSQNLANTPAAMAGVAKEIKSKLTEQKNNLYAVNRERFKRIRRIKKFLRPLPRRSNIHKYPVLKWFAETAYKRSYLWSFRGAEISSALFWGIWISMLPIVGIQMLVVFFISLLVRANLPLIVALQWISNPLTMGPIYFADYKIGLSVLNLLGVDYQRNKLLSAEYNWSEFTFSDLLRLIDTFPPMLVGGSVLGISMGLSTVFLYKTVANFYKSRRI